MFDLDIDERKRYNRVVLIAFLIGAIIYSLLGFMGTRSEIWGELQHEVIQLPDGEYLEIEIEPFPAWFPIFGFFVGGWLISGVASGFLIGWRLLRHQVSILKFFLLLFIWPAFAMIGMILGVPYGIYNVFVIRKYKQGRAPDEMSTLEMNIHGKENVFMHKLFTEHIFDEQLFEVYFDELKVLSVHNERKEMLKLVVRRNDKILSTISNHFLPDHPLQIENIPPNISDYTERIQLENKRLLKLL